MRGLEGEVELVGRHERARHLPDAVMKVRETVNVAIDPARDVAGGVAGFAVIDADREEVIALATGYEQNAIYEWTPEHRAVVWSDPALRVDTHPWRATSP